MNGKIYLLSDLGCLLHPSIGTVWSQTICRVHLHGRWTTFQLGRCRDTIHNAGTKTLITNNEAIGFDGYFSYFSHLVNPSRMPFASINWEETLCITTWVKNQVEECSMNWLWTITVSLKSREVLDSCGVWLFLIFPDKPHNPLLNSGAIMSAAILLYLVNPEMKMSEKFDFLSDYIKRIAGGEFLRQVLMTI